jgi:cell division protein ZapA
MKQLEVQIMGQSYLLGCPEGGESRLLEAVERVDTAMCKIREAGKVRARDRIAVLAALNLAFDVTDRAPDLAVLPASASAAASAGAKPPSTQVSPAVQSPDSATDSDVLLISLLERLDQALGEDGRLL